jgi:AAA15 family ATPase/GTPase
LIADTYDLQKPVAMIQNLTIKNFKSIKELEIPCKKLNVFIGEPNSGKSNIIEAFALQSQNSFPQELNKQIFRYKTIGDLFYDFDINNPVEVQTDTIHSILKYAVRQDGIIENQFHFFIKKENKRPAIITHDGKITDHGDSGQTNVHYYEFKRLDSYLMNYIPHLACPDGNNLPTLLLANNGLKKWVSEYLKSKMLKLTFKPVENEILFSKLIEDEIYSFPYFMLSETLQRMIFYSIAIKSNKNSVILFDEPETNTFPPYTKELAERIADDETNQFFITTHNPYLLINLIEKTKIENISVFITEMRDYQTIAHLLNQDQISEVLDLNSDVFFNFDRILAL